MEYTRIINDLASNYWQLVLFIQSPIGIMTLVGVLVLIIIAININYKKSTYYQISKIPYLLMRFDPGRYGEYLTYKYLKSYEKNGAKFLFNLYIPKKDGTTTEIDVIMICSKGIFVFESKNYSGWIFGNESQKYWYQTLPSGRSKSTKQSFYNPVMQNASHINSLITLLKNDIPAFSIITFSERCTLKKVNVESGSAKVIKRNEVFDTVSNIYAHSNDILSVSMINEIANTLYPYSQNDNHTKEQHTDNISKRMWTNRPYDSSNDTVCENAELKCPNCGAPLILRTAKKGANTGKQFYGCSNFPKCKFTKNKQ